MELLPYRHRRPAPAWCLAAVVLALAACGGPDAPPEVAEASSCVGCHREATPGIVTDWELSRHSGAGVDCSLCHGDGHRTADDVALVKMATVEVCAGCHSIQAEQFTGGKHALAWASMNRDAHDALAADGAHRGHEGMRRVSPDRGSRPRTTCGSYGPRAPRSVWRRATPATRATCSRSPRRGNRRRAGPATWGSTTRSGRCTRRPSTVCATS